MRKVREKEKISLAKYYELIMGDNGHGKDNNGIKDNNAFNNDPLSI